MKRLAFLVLPVLLFACRAPLSAQEQALADQPPVSIEDVFDRVHQSVVTLRTAGRTVLPDMPTQFTSIQGIGSGVLFNDKGDILTAAHVVQTADEVLVEFPNGKIGAGRVISSVPSVDLALVRFIGPIPDGVVPATLGDSDEVRVGQRIMVVGAPLGISHTLTVGHVSARRGGKGLMSSMTATELFQTDAAINQGNSGGPMFNMQGEVVGIVSHIVSKTGGHQGLGFAVTSNVARELLIDAAPFWSGADGLYVTSRMAEILNTPGGRSGYLIQRVAKNSPSEALGLVGGDLLVNIAGQEILLGGDIVLVVQDIPFEEENIDRIRELVAQLGPNDEMKLLVLRGGKLLRITGKR
jgi:serine protease Do